MDFLGQPQWKTSTGNTIKMGTPGPQGSVLVGQGEGVAPAWISNAQFGWKVPSSLTVIGGFLGQESIVSYVINQYTGETISASGNVKVNDLIYASYQDRGIAHFEIWVCTDAETCACRLVYYWTENIETTWFDKIYPVGSIYMSMNSTNPSTLFGGTWEQINDRFLYATTSGGASGATGGEAAHTLSESEMPHHSHAQRANRYGSLTTEYMIGTDGGGGRVYGFYFQDGVMGSGTDTAVQTQEVGGSQPHNNLPPYLRVYMWQRTA